jgi:hypothetical protein
MLDVNVSELGKDCWVRHLVRDISYYDNEDLISIPNRRVSNYDA